MKKSQQIFFRKLGLFVAAIFMVSAVWAQQSITGTVVDDGGGALPGVTVVIKGTTTGTVTNTDGIYSLDAPADAVLLFTFVGMKVLEEPVDGRTTINVTMLVDAIGIEEVVAVGYGTQKKVNMTGSVVSIQAEELVKAPVANVSEILSGRSPGLYTKQLNKRTSCLSRR